MKKRIKSILLNILSHLTPEIYLRYLFRKHRKANFDNIERLKLKAEPLLLKYLLKKGDKFFDVGSNIGEFIYCSLDHISSEHIFAFEANPESFRTLKWVFNKCRIFDIALSSQEGTAQFKIPIVNGNLMPTRGTLKTDYTELDEDGARLITVKTQTIDSFVSKYNVDQIGIIKMDVEGFETEVIKGALATISDQKPILIAELEQRHMDEPLDTAIDRIKKLGYRCFYFDIDSLSIKELVDRAEDIQQKKYHKINPVRFINNFIFIHNHSIFIDGIESINNKIGSANDN